jgi:uncharacterized protein (TIGR03437 family)
MTARYAWMILTFAGLNTATHLSGQTGTPFEIAIDSLPTAFAGSSYFQQVNTTGGLCPATGTATSTLVSGVLPPGVLIISPVSNEKKWFLLGTPTAMGSFQFSVRLRWSHSAISPFDTNCVDEAVKTLTVVVQAPVTPLVVDRAQITTTYRTGHFPPLPDAVQVTAGGGPNVSFTAQSVTDSGGAWLSVTPDRAVTPAVLSLNYSISGLRPGTYTGRVILSANNSIVIPVTLIVVTDSNIVLQPSPTSFSFSMAAGAPDPASQPLAVSVSGDSVIFQASVSAPPNGWWLTVSPNGAATPGRLTVAVVSKDLSPGVYSGVITLAVSGGNSSSRTIPVTFTIQAPLQRPAISANGVVNAAGLGNAISPGTWVSIFGTALAPTTRSWLASDFVNGLLPTSLDGVGVTINGKPAAVAFISPTQINVLAPDDTATGLVPVQVKNSILTGDIALALQQTASPALFQLSAGSSLYAAGIHADGSYLAGPALTQSGIPGRPARPGEIISLFGTGFGVTQPRIPATAPVTSALPIARLEDLRVRIGGLDAAIVYAGLISPGVYQFNVVVPQLEDGDKPVVAEFRGLLTRPDLVLTVQQ